MSKPNIILILIDDMGWRDISCCGSEFYETPNIDRLAREGMTFTDGYASCPVCSPTRASIMTGRYPARLGVTDWIDWMGAVHPRRGRVIDVPYIKHLPLEEKTVAGALRDAGYSTWHIGKWHLGGEPYWPEKHGFDVNVAGCEWGLPVGGYFSPYSMPNLEDGPEGEYLTDRLTDEAIRLVRENGEKPFFMYMSHYVVHGPIQTPRKYVEKYEKKARELGLDKVKTYEQGEPMPYEHDGGRKVVRRLVQSDAAYAGMIENLDENVGRLFAALEEAGKTDNTLIIFTSDNGGLATSEGLDLPPKSGPRQLSDLL
ncbi:MAG: sulfatase [Kiritimatiellia bacterium]